MGHHSAGRLVFDALMDYPANAILQRVGLLESMMNLLTAVDTHETGDYIKCISSPLHICLTSLHVRRLHLLQTERKSCIAMVPCFDIEMWHSIEHLFEW